VTELIALVSVLLNIALCFYGLWLERNLHSAVTAADSLAEALHGIAYGELEATIDADGNVTIDTKRSE
jgi:hypothetical protein